MTYCIPSTLPKLEQYVRKHSLSFVTERQAAFLIQQLLKTKFKFPAKGESCFPVLQRLEAALTDRSGGTHQTVLTGNVYSDLTGVIPSDRRASVNDGQEPASSKPKHGKGRKAKAPRIPASSATGFDTGLVIFCDGACEPNPGAGGWAFVVYRDGVEIHSECGGDPVSTNNIMEMTGALMALRWIAIARTSVSNLLNKRATAARLLCDSQYVVKGCNEWRHGWKAKGWKRGGPKAKDKNSVIANLDLWKELDAALTATPITLEWVKGHAGTKGNERADELADMGRLDALTLAETEPAGDIRAAIEKQLAVPA